MSNIFELSYYILVGVLSVMSLVLFLLPVRQNVRLEGYQVSLRLMGVSFLSLALYCCFKWAIPSELVSFYFLFMSHLQANLLGLGHINMVAPKKVKMGYVFRRMLPLFACTLAYVLTLPFVEHTHLSSYDMLLRPEVYGSPEVIVRFVWMGVYLMNVAYYAVVFFRSCAAYMRLAEDFFSETDRKACRVIRSSFISALLVGVTTILITASLHPVVSAMLNGCILIFYSLMAAFYIQYPTFFPQMEAVIYDVPEQQPNEEHSIPESEQLWAAIRSRIIEEQLYMRKGLTMEQLAREMTVSRTVMSALINRCEGVNFNTFINRLRVEQACSLMASNPDLLISELSDMVGYADASNLARSFRLHKRMTPKQYRDQLFSHSNER